MTCKYSYCINLADIIIPEGVTVISSRCFEACYKLKTIRIPSTILHIDTDSFRDCYDIILEVPKGLSSKYSQLNIEGISGIIEYDSDIKIISNELKKRTEEFLKVQDYKRKKEDYEIRKEMGLLTREEYEAEERFYDDVDDKFYNDNDDWDDL